MRITAKHKRRPAPLRYPPRLVHRSLPAPTPGNVPLAELASIGPRPLHALVGQSGLTGAPAVADLQWSELVVSDPPPSRSVGRRWCNQCWNSTFLDMGTPRRPQNPMLGEIRRSRAILLLQPTDAAEIVQATGTRVSLRPGLQMVPGRGVFLADRQPTVVQVAVTQ